MWEKGRFFIIEYSVVLLGIREKAWDLESNYVGRSRVEGGLGKNYDWTLFLLGRGVGEIR